METVEAGRPVRRPAITPAAFSKELVEPIVEAFRRHTPWDGGRLIDPFAGIGVRFAEMAEQLGMDPVGIEIEEGYFRGPRQAHPCVIQGNSRMIPFPDGHFDGAISSCAYPNGISDNFHSNEGSLRHTYVHRLRQWFGNDYELHPDNAGGLNPRRSPAALKRFYSIHEDVWAEMFRVLRPGAVFVLNTKDTTKVPFRQDTERQLALAGFEVVEVIQVSIRGLNHGENRENKLDFEDLTVVRRSW